jgi:putative hydrolase of the HAD superfamily
VEVVTKKIRRPELIVFDLDDTLYEYSDSNNYAEDQLFAFLSQEISIETKAIIASFATARATVKRRLGETGSSHSRLLYLNELFRVLELNPRPSFLLRAEQIFWSSYMEKMKQKTGLEDFISSARHMKIPLVLLSDLTLNIQLKKLLSLGMDNTFDQIYVSEELGGDKKTGFPLRELQEILQSKTCIWFVGDQPHDFILDRAGNEFFTFGKIDATFNGNKHPISNFIELEKILHKAIYRLI